MCVGECVFAINGHRDNKARARDLKWSALAILDLFKQISK